jgi:hypothetical protein
MQNKKSTKAINEIYKKGVKILALNLLFLILNIKRLVANKIIDIPTL